MRVLSVFTLSIIIIIDCIMKAMQFVQQQQQQLMAVQQQLQVMGVVLLSMLT